MIPHSEGECSIHYACRPRLMISLFPYQKLKGNACFSLTNQYGVMISFEKPIYLNGYFLGFEGWDSLNEQFGSSNISFIVRVEFELSTFKENRIKRKFKLFWWVLIYLLRFYLLNEWHREILFVLILEAYDLKNIRFAANFCKLQLIKWRGPLTWPT